MTRALRWFVGLALVASISAWLADRPGNIVVDWQGWRVETSVAAGAIAFAALLAAGALAYRGWLWLRRGPRAIGRARRDRRRRRGEAVLSGGMTALAAGESDEALKLGRRAASLLDESPLPLMLSAQAAQQAGDTSEAARLYRRMLDAPDTEFLGARGLLMQALRSGDTRTALRHARRAHALRPASPWVQNLLFDLQSAAGLWREALVTLDDASRRKVFDKPTGRRRKALTLFAQARDVDAAGDTETAAALARDAHALSPEFVPAAMLAARHYQADGETGKAVRVIETSWRKSPHPELAALYLALHPEDDPARRVRRMARLDRLHAGHREGRVALAGALITARRWREARGHLDKALAEREERRLFRLMARVEEGEHGSAATGMWLQRASSAPPDDTWVCQGCGGPAADWFLHCERCGRFDSLVWGVTPEPPSGAAVVAAGANGNGGSPAALARLSETLRDSADPARAPLAIQGRGGGGDVVDPSPPRA